MKRIKLDIMRQEQFRITKDLSLGKEKLNITVLKLGWTERHTRRKLKEYQKKWLKNFYS